MTQVLDFLQATAALTEHCLEEALPAADRAPKRLHEAMRYAVLAGGKRIRPALALAACRACGGEDEACHGAMAGIELFHTYTLVHDDLPAMDDDDLRRGKPTVHKAYDEPTAILVGDALQAAAFAAVAPLGSAAVSCLAYAGGSEGVVGGQQDDLDHTGRLSELSETDARVVLGRIHARKTAALIVASCELGAIAAGADITARDSLRRFGNDIGLAFQIVDDLLDVEASAHELGKTPGKDAEQGKVTYISLHGIDASRVAATQAYDSALAALKPFAEQAKELRSLAEFIVKRGH